MQVYSELFKKHESFIGPIKRFVAMWIRRRARFSCGRWASTDRSFLAEWFLEGSSTKFSPARPYNRIFLNVGDKKSRKKSWWPPQPLNLTKIFFLDWFISNGTWCKNILPLVPNIYSRKWGQVILMLHIFPANVHKRKGPKKEKVGCSKHVFKKVYYLSFPTMTIIIMAASFWKKESVQGGAR